MVYIKFGNRRWVYKGKISRFDYSKTEIFCIKIKRLKRGKWGEILVVNKGDKSL